VLHSFGLLSVPYSTLPGASSLAPCQAGPFFASLKWRRIRSSDKGAAASWRPGV